MDQPDFATAQWSAPVEPAAGRRVEIVYADQMVGLRDSAHPDGPVLTFDADEWRAFLAGVRRGEFDVTTLCPASA